jgi:hypothetical protein
LKGECPRRRGAAVGRERLSFTFLFLDAIIRVVPLGTDTELNRKKDVSYGKIYTAP